MYLRKLFRSDDTHVHKIAAPAHLLEKPKKNRLNKPEEIWISHDLMKMHRWRCTCPPFYALSVFSLRVGGTSYGRLEVQLHAPRDVSKNVASTYQDSRSWSCHKTGAKRLLHILLCILKIVVAVHQEEPPEQQKPEKLAETWCRSGRQHHCSSVINKPEPQTYVTVSFFFGNLRNVQDFWSR